MTLANRHRLLTFLPVIAAALVFYFSAPVQNFIPFGAQTVTSPATSTLSANGTPSKTSDLTTVQVDGTSVKCSSLPVAKDGILLGRVVPCLINTITSSTAKFSAQMVSMFQPLFYSFLVLVVVFFGLKVLQGDQQMHVQGIQLLIKIAICSTLLSQLPNTTLNLNDNSMEGIIPAMYDIIADGISITTSAIGPDASSIHCNISQYGYGNGKQTPLIWAQMDCILGKVYGFAAGKDPATGADTANMLLAASAAGLLSGFFFGGTMGVTIFFALVGVLVSLFMLVVNVTRAVLTGYLKVCVLLIVAPLFLPLMFLKVTSGNFDRWWSAILGGLITPIIISAYAMYALLIYDKMLFAPDSMLQNLFDNKQVQYALQQKRAPCTMQVAGNNDSRTTTDVTVDPQGVKAQLDKMFKNPFLQNIGNPLLSGANDACGMFQMAQFDPSKMPGVIDVKKTMEDFFYTSIKLVIMGFILMKGLTMVESKLAAIVNSSSTTAALGPTRFEQTISKNYAGLQQNLKSSFKVKGADGNPTEARGSQFMTQAGSAVKDSMATFMGIRKN